MWPSFRNNHNQPGKRLFILTFVVLLLLLACFINIVLKTGVAASSPCSDRSSPTGGRGRANESQPYFIKQLEDIELDEDFGIFILNLTDCAFDNEDPQEALRWYIVGENTSIIEITNENSSDQRIFIKSINNAYGENAIKLWVGDTTGLNDFQKIVISVHPLNDLPKLLQSSLPVFMLHPDIPYSIDLEPYIIDPDTAISKIKMTVASKDSEVATVQDHKLDLDFTKNKDFDRDHITLKLSDGINASEFSRIDLKINLTDNYPPIILKTIPNIILYKDESLNNILDLDYYFTDSDHAKDSLTYEYFLGDHLKIKLHEDNTMDISSSGTWEGVEQLIIRCIDPLGAFREQVINVTVTSEYVPVILSEIPDLRIHYDSEYFFNLTPYINLGDLDLPKIQFEILEFINERWRASTDRQNIAFNNSKTQSIMINYSKEYLNETIPVLISISDGTTTQFQEFLIMITANFPPIIKSPIPNQVFDEDHTSNSTIDLYDFFVDPDGDEIEFFNLSVNIIVDIKENGLLDLASKPEWSGNELVTIRSIDSNGAISEASFTVTVNPINDGPKILPIPQINVTQGVLKFEYLNYLFDIDNEISELSISVEGDHITIAGDLLILEYPLDVDDTQEFTLTVSDGQLFDSQVVRVSIITGNETDKQTVNEISPILLWGTSIILIIMVLVLVTATAVYYRRLKAFKFNELYLIFKDGLLIAHAAREKKRGHDSDIIGGMFTAIQDFIQQSFSDVSNTTESSGLKRLDFGDFQIAINRGEHIFIAAVFSGYALRSRLMKIEKLRIDIEKKYCDILPKWSGNMHELDGTQDLIEDLLYSTGPPRDFEVEESNDLDRMVDDKIDDNDHDLDNDTHHTHGTSESDTKSNNNEPEDK